LSVDTGSVHLAAAVDCTVFGIYNGSQYGRFAPYPKEIKNNFFTVYPNKLEKDIQQNKINKYELITDIAYETVSAEKVIKKIKSIY
jgi:ADP-heptose:LPS heptosyltransferase